MSVVDEFLKEILGGLAWSNCRKHRQLNKNKSSISFVVLGQELGVGGGGHWLVRMEWRPASWSVCLPLLIFPCTIKSRSSFLALAHPGGPGKMVVKRLWWFSDNKNQLNFEVICVQLPHFFFCEASFTYIGDCL